jgi:hypothetical protein
VGNTGKARQAFDEALRHKPDFPEAVAALAALKPQEARPR